MLPEEILDIPDLWNGAPTVPPPKPRNQPHLPPHPAHKNMNNNNNTMNNNNNDNDNTMNNSSNVSSSNSLLMVEAVLSTPAQKHQPATSSALYKVAARNLREYHGVPSMTALKLEKTVALLGLAPCRMVVQGLAPRRLLKSGQGGSLPLVLAGDSSDEGQEELREAEICALVDENLNNTSSSGDQDEEEEEEEEVGQEDILFSDDSNSTYDDNGDSIDNIGNDTQGDVKADGNGSGKTRRPVHAALVAGGISLRPRETRPLLCALGVSPRRLVRLGLVKREAIRAMAGGRGGGRGQHLRTGGPGKRGVEGPRGPSRGSPHAIGGPSAGCGPSRPMQHGPPGRIVHGAGRHTKLVRGQEKGMSAPLGSGPHACPGHRGPRHQGEYLQGPPHGPGHPSMLTGRHGRGPPGGGKHGHGHRHPPHGHRHGHGHGHDGGGLDGEVETEGGGERQHAGARGPGHRGPRHPGREGMSGSRGRPQGPPHGPPDGPFHGLFHEEGAPRAPPGMMAHPRHGSPSRGGCGMKQRGGRLGGGKRFCGGGGRGGGGGSDMRLGRMVHLAHCNGRQQLQLEAY